MWGGWAGRTARRGHTPAHVPEELVVLAVPQLLAAGDPEGPCSTGPWGQGRAGTRRALCSLLWAQPGPSPDWGEGGSGIKREAADASLKGPLPSRPASYIRGPMGLQLCQSALLANPWRRPPPITTRCRPPRPRTREAARARLHPSEREGEGPVRRPLLGVALTQRHHHVTRGSLRLPFHVTTEPIGLAKGRRLRSPNGKGEAVCPGSAGGAGSSGWVGRAGLPGFLLRGWARSLGCLVVGLGGTIRVPLRGVLGEVTGVLLGGEGRNHGGPLEGGALGETIQLC